MKIFTCRKKIAKNFEDAKAFSIIDKKPVDLHIDSVQEFPGLIWCKHENSRETSWPPRNKDTCLEICLDCNMSRVCNGAEVEEWAMRDVLAERANL